MTIDISYGVLNYNPYRDEAATKAYVEAVESLANNRSSKFKSEVYLIDQANQPELTQDLGKQYGFNVVALRSNVGISRGINMLANLARGRFVSLVTSDVIFTPGLDEILISALEANPNIYQICPVSDNSSLDHQRYDRARKDGILVENIVQELTIQFWPRTVFDKIGYFDERWKACYENMDFALRAFLDGGSIMVHQGAFCPHKHNMCTKSGAINHSYDGYIDIAGGFGHEPLMQMWNEKWPGLKNSIDIYQTITRDMGLTRALMFYTYSQNVYLPFLQEVGY